MKKIAITQRLTQNEAYFEEREMLDTSWGRVFNDTDFIPIILPYEYDFKKYFTEIKIDGVLLTGGNDLHELNENNLSEKRDIFEIRLIEYALENSIPILGVCRGMQIIAKYFGCTFSPIENQINTKHNLIVNEKSQYSDYLNKLEEVNSFHRYTVSNLSNELIVSATNENRVIKAIEHKHYKVFAQMWHSEREVPFNLNELHLIHAFFSDTISK